MKRRRSENTYSQPDINTLFPVTSIFSFDLFVYIFTKIYIPISINTLDTTHIAWYFFCVKIFLFLFSFRNQKKSKNSKNRHTHKETEPKYTRGKRGTMKEVTKKYIKIHFALFVINQTKFPFFPFAFFSFLSLFLILHC